MKAIPAGAATREGLQQVLRSGSEIEDVKGAPAGEAVVATRAILEGGRSGFVQLAPGSGADTLNCRGLLHDRCTIAGAA